MGDPPTSNVSDIFPCSFSCNNNTTSRIVNPQEVPGYTILLKLTKVKETKALSCPETLQKTVCQILKVTSLSAAGYAYHHSELPSMNSVFVFLPDSHFIFHNFVDKNMVTIDMFSYAGSNKCTSVYEEAKRIFHPDCVTDCVIIRR